PRVRQKWRTRNRSSGDRWQFRNARGRSGRFRDVVTCRRGPLHYFRLFFNRFPGLPVSFPGKNLLETSRTPILRSTARSGIGGTLRFFTPPRSRRFFLFRFLVKFL